MNGNFYDFYNLFTKIHKVTKLYAKLFCRNVTRYALS